MKAWFLVGAAALGCVGGCAAGETIVSDADPPAAVEVGERCADDPSICTEAETCWVDADKDGYRCHTAGQGEAGEPCNNVAGRPSCAHGLTCYDVSGYDPVCTPLCDEGQCPGEAPCQALAIDGIGESIRVCQPPSR